MTTTLPTLTRTIDDKFTNTWYEIRAEAIDNILDAVVVWAALKDRGRFTTQVGEEYITRTIRYGTVDSKAVHKGSIFSQGEPKLKTMARWTWRYLSGHAQRSVFDDQKNNGEFKIASLVADRLNAARESLVAHYETRCLATAVTAETGDEIQGLNDMVPTYANSSSGTYGAIGRAGDYVDSGNGVWIPLTTSTNPWWGPKYLQLSAPYEVNLISDMKKLYNSVHNNQVPPDLILSDQTLYELYEDFGLDASQIIKNEGSTLVDLGFQVLKFKGKDMTWSPNMNSNNMLFLTTSRIEVVYDPELWFDMTHWKDIPLQGERIAHILCCCNMISTELRRHGRLTDQTVS